MQTIGLKSYKPDHLLQFGLVILLLCGAGSGAARTFRPMQALASASTVSSTLLSKQADSYAVAVASTLQSQSQPGSWANSLTTLNASQPNQLPAGLYTALHQQRQATSGQAALIGSDGVSSDLFGTRVAISSDGNTALVGAYAKQVGTNFDQGEAYIFTRSGLNWSQQVTLTAADGAAFDYFGWSVALSGDGNTALVGAFNKTVGFNTEQGEASVFSRVGNSWFQTATLTDPDGAASDHFSTSVALSEDGSTAVIGAPDQTVGNNDHQGTVYVFTQANSTWSNSDTIHAADGAAGDEFGNALALSNDGNTTLIAAPGKTVGTNTGQGVTYFFTRANSIWTQQTNLTDPDGAANANFGRRIALSKDGNTALMAAYNMQDPNNPTGEVHIFSQVNSVWGQQTLITAPDSSSTSDFGWSVALSGDGNSALVGNVDYNNFQGESYVFNRYSGNWYQQLGLTAPDGAASDYFGWSVDLNSDGRTAIVGAPFKTVNGNGQQGGAYTFDSQPILLVSNPNPSQAGQTVTFTATVSPIQATGTVTFTDGMTVLGTAPIVSSTAIYSTGSLTAGSHPITARYGGDTTYPALSSPIVTQVVNSISSNLGLTGSPNPALAGQSISFTATVSPVAATGSVTFTIDNSVSVPITLANGTAVYSTTALSVGSHTIVATYGGDGFYSSSTQTITQVVKVNSSSLNLMADPNPSLVGQSVTFTATVSPTTASGLVSFTIDSGLASTATLSNGIATYTTSTLSAGSHLVKAAYSGDSLYAASSATITQVVNLNSATLSLASDPNPSFFGQAITFTATVSPGAATGIVSFTEGVTVLGTATLVSGTAVYTNATLSVGSHVITANYGGEAAYNGATSQPITQVVTAGCLPLLVTAITDDGTGTRCGTLSYALSQPMTGTTPVSITFALVQGNMITFTGSLTTNAALKAYMVLDGGIPKATQPIVINGNGVSGDGLHLKGHNFLRNLTIYGFGGRQLVLENPANRFQAVKIIA